MTAEPTGELRERVARPFVDALKEMQQRYEHDDWAIWDWTEEADALLSGPLAPLLAKLRAVETLARTWERRSVFHAEHGAQATAVGLMHRVNDLHRALDAEAGR